MATEKSDTLWISYPPAMWIFTDAYPPTDDIVENSSTVFVDKLNVQKVTEVPFAQF